ncbi:hypothetical protein FACS189485_21020 [Spirochaetia bacterium]|nr:hypothetical protein FACS189485_21020 [Spirochaetia bacterium]
MLFCNDISKIKRALLYSVKYISIIIAISFITSFIPIYYLMKYSGIENIGFFIAVTILMEIIICLIMLFIRSLNFNKEYKGFEIEIQENCIYEKSNNIEILFNQISDVIKDKDGNIFIYNNEKIIAVSKYLSNIIEFENIISKIHVIKEKQINFFLYIIAWLPFMFLVGTFIFRYTKNVELCLFTGICYIVTAIHSLIGKVKEIKNTKGIIWIMLFGIISDVIFIVITALSVFSIIIIYILGNS